ncbi:MAG: DUF1622 domain-containing protein [Bdellovibrionales bacterium]
MEMGSVNHVMTWTAKIIEICGVVIIIIGGLVSTFDYLKALRRQATDAYEQYRGSLGRAILLGLEFRVAGDIIGTVAVEPSYESLGILGLVVLIRTFLSFSLEVEISGHWPWQGRWLNQKRDCDRGPSIIADLVRKARAEGKRHQLRVSKSNHRAKALRWDLNSLKKLRPTTT